METRSGFWSSSLPAKPNMVSPGNIVVLRIKSRVCKRAEDKSMRKYGLGILIKNVGGSWGFNMYLKVIGNL